MNRSRGAGRLLKWTINSRDSVIADVGGYYVNPEFTYPELRSIDSVWRAVNNLERGISVESELPGMLIHELVEEQTFRVRRIACLLPASCHRALADHLADLEEKDYFGRLFYFGPGLTEEEQRALQPRFRAACESLRDFLDNPKSPSDLPAFPIDIFWHSLLDSPTLPTECKNPVCSQRRIRLSVLCAYHHYIQIKGQPPAPYPPT